ncbi:MAG: glycerophosphodiester phosphodiesterase family protein, partial [Gemmatimonadota bacterium]
SGLDEDDSFRVGTLLLGSPDQVHPSDVHPLLDLTARPVVGHRGNCARAPENTLESFRQAVALGVDALEFDVRVTRDGEIVVFHDPTVQRTTGAEGAVAALTLAQLRTLDAGATFSSDGGRTHPYRARSVGVPTLAEVLEELPGTPVLIEIKVVDAAPGTRSIIERMGAESRCIVASFDAEALSPFAGSHIPIGAAPGMVAPLLVPALLGRRFTTLPFQAMSLPRFYRGFPVPLGALARAAAPAGVPVHAWTINSPSTAQALWRRGVRGIISDDPARILKVRRR